MWAIFADTDDGHRHTKNGQSICHLPAILMFIHPRDVLMTNGKRASVKFVPMAQSVGHIYIPNLNRSGLFRVGYANLPKLL